MPAKVITEEKEKEVGMMSNVDATFVSLVENGANRQPFRIIKEEGGGKKTMISKVQSILVPVGMNMTDLQKDESLSFLTDAKTDDVQKFESYTKYTQAGIEKFQKDSIRIIKLKDESLAIVGSLAPDVDDTDVMSISEELEKAISIDDVSALDVPIEAGRQFMLSFGDLFHKELDTFVSILINSMRQANSKPAKRKQTVLNAFDAFKSFMIMGLDAIGSEKMDDSQLEKIQAGLTGPVKKEANNNNLEDVDMTKEEIQEIVKGQVQDSLKDAFGDEFKKTIAGVVQESLGAIDKQKADEKAASEAEENEKKKSEDFEVLKKSVAGIVSTLEKMGEQPITDAAGGTSDDTDPANDKKKADDVDTETEEEEAGIFDGLIFKKD